MMSNENEFDPADLMDRIRTHLYLCEIIPLEWFEDFDKLRSGRVSKDQFRRCFQFLKFSLNEAEHKYLCNTFEDRGDVNYRAFCHTVQDIFTNQDIEHDPTGEIVDGELIVAKTQHRLESDFTPDIKAMFAKMVHQIKTHGIHVREAYMDFDTHNSGHVTTSQFLRALPFKDITPHEQTLLIQRYGDPVLHDVNYKKLHQELCNFTEKFVHGDPKVDITLPNHLNSFKLNPFPSNPSDVIERFGAYTRRNRVRVYDFFSFHDRLKSGRVTCDVFMNVLTLFGFQFSEEELHYLADKYKITIDYTNYSNYRDFVADVERAASKPQTENSEGEAASKVRSSNPRLNSILSTISQFIERDRINILPPLQDFDCSKRGYVTPLQFQRVLSMMKVPVKEQDISVLISVYGQSSGVDYFKFVEDIDKHHNQSRRNFKPLGTTKANIEQIYGHTPSGDQFVTTEEADHLIYESKKGLLPKLGEKHDINSLMNNLKQWAYIHSVTFHDFLHDFDPLNLGTVTETQFRSAVLMSGYRLTDQEFELLKQNYAASNESPEKNTSTTFLTGQNGGGIKMLWKKFADDVQSFVAPKNLENSPTSKPINPALVTSKYYQEDEQKKKPTPAIQRILSNINKYMISRRIALKEQFTDKDLHNHKEVSATSFAQVMQLIGMHISKNEIDQLCAYYLDPETNFVKYPEFVQDVEALGSVYLRDSSHNTLVVNPRPEYAIEISNYVASCPTITAEQLTWKPLLAKLQSYVLKRRVRVIQFCQNFDHLHHGTITQQKFRSVVGETGLPLTEDEIQFIIGMFAVDGKKDLFNYVAFCSKIDEVFGRTDLNRHPTESGTVETAYIPDPSRSVATLAPQDQKKLNDILNRMHNYVATRRMEVRQQFDDYDKYPHRNYITKAQFKQCICRLGLTSDPNEMDLLCKKYRCTDLDEQNYLAFCNDIESGI